MTAMTTLASIQTKKTTITERDGHRVVLTTSMGTKPMDIDVVVNMLARLIVDAVEREQLFVRGEQ